MDFMMRNTLLALLVLMLPLGALATPFTYSGDGSNGFVTGESVTATNMNEIDTRLDVLDTISTLNAALGTSIPGTAHTVDTQLSAESVEDMIGAMLSGTQTNITVTYDDANAELDFVASSGSSPFTDRGTHYESNQPFIFGGDADDTCDAGEVCAVSGVLTADSIETRPVAAPSYPFEDSTNSDSDSDAEITVEDNASNDGRMMFWVEIAGTLDNWLDLNGLTNAITLGDGTNVSSISLSTSATGDSALVLPAGSVSDGEIGTGITRTIASGTASLGTSAIAANGCATLVTVSATGTLSTDVVAWSPNADIEGVNGYGVGSSGDGLVIYDYPTANNVNFKICNATGSSITPGSVTLNWRVTR